LKVNNTCLTRCSQTGKGNLDRIGFISNDSNGADTRKARLKACSDASRRTRCSVARERDALLGAEATDAACSGDAGDREAVPLRVIPCTCIPRPFCHDSSRNPQKRG
jgi:hypothetical protein